MSISIEVLWIAVALVTWGALAAFRMTVFTRTRFQVAVLYKSGNRIDQWFTKFNVHRGEWSWASYFSFETPLTLGVDDIEATWIIDRRVNIFHWIYINAKAIMDLIYNRLGGKRAT